MSKTKVIVGLSGGVDSSVSALLLLQQGYEVEGLFMKNWEEDDDTGYCSATADLADAQAVCDKLGIKLHKVNFAAEYWDEVFEHCLAEFRAGRTPNPDILCNSQIKFKAFLNYAKSLGADYIATGHYAGIAANDGNYQLLRGEDHNKDQSYFLYTLGQQQLASSLFPLAHIAKPKVRELAAANDLITHNKKDSTGICFIGERKFKEFLQRFIPAQPGNIVTPDGTTIGKHHGLMFYTLGQRQGLGIGGTKNYPEAPWYVAAKDLKSNELIVVQDPNDPLLMQQELTANNVLWVKREAPAAKFTAMAKIRYRQSDQACEVEVSGDTIKISFAEPQRAITPGQAVVLYDNQFCLGGGTIL